jgi:hypothetical protein
MSWDHYNLIVNKLEKKMKLNSKRTKPVAWVMRTKLFYKKNKKNMKPICQLTHYWRIELKKKQPRKKNKLTWINLVNLWSMSWDQDNLIKNK